MVGHEHISIEDESKPRLGALKPVKVLPAVSIIKKNRLPLIAPDNDMVGSARIFYVRRPCH